MPKHSVFSRRAKKPSKPAIHPAWRGIGCIFMITIPVIAYLVSNLLIKNISEIPWLAIPPEMIVKNYTDQLILVRLLYTTLISLLLFLLISLITFILNSLFNPKQKGPYDL